MDSLETLKEESLRLDALSKLLTSVSQAPNGACKQSLVTAIKEELDSPRDILGSILDDHSEAISALEAELLEKSDIIQDLKSDKRKLEQELDGVPSFDESFYESIENKSKLPYYAVGIICLLIGAMLGLKA